MEEFKLDLFFKEHGQQFPNYTTLVETDCRKIPSTLTHQLGLVNSDELTEEIVKRSDFILDVDANDGFVLSALLEKVGCLPSDKVLVNWDRFEHIDEISLVTLDTYFDDIWFSSADDIDLIHSELRWVVSVRHDGTVSCLNFKGR